MFSPDTLIHAADLLDVLYLHDTASLDFTVSGYAAEQTFFIVPQYMVSSKSDLLTADQSRDALSYRRVGHKKFCQSAHCRFSTERI